MLKQYKQCKKLVKVLKGAQSEKDMEKLMKKVQQGQGLPGMKRKKMRF